MAGSRVINHPGGLDGEAIRRKVVEFGGIQDGASLGVRSSDRIRAQPNADATQLERATAWVQRRDLTQGTNLNPLFSIMSFADDQIIDRAAKLGVSLGTSHLEKIKAAKAIKDSEFNRSLVLLQKNVGSIDMDDPQNLILNRAASLSEDLEDDELNRNLEDQLDLIVPVEKTRKNRPRKDYSSTTRRRSVRLKKQSKR